MKITKKSDLVRFKYRVAGLALYQGHVLIHQFEGSDYWSLPGGNVELGESSEEALVRELYEEAGLEIEVVRLLWVHENYFVRHSGKQVHEICFYYLIRLKKEETFRFIGAEGKTKLYFKWALLEDLALIPLVPTFLKTNLHLLPGQPVHIVSFEEKPSKVDSDG
jgi:8-oxo-dGTP pyrophosphatase MutT (NUDIX family)